MSVNFSSDVLSFLSVHFSSLVLPYQAYFSAVLFACKRKFCSSACSIQVLYVIQMCVNFSSAVLSVHLHFLPATLYFPILQVPVPVPVLQFSALLAVNLNSVESCLFTYFCSYRQFTQFWCLPAWSSSVTSFIFFATLQLCKESNHTTARKPGPL